MMDNPEYARAAIRKIESYEKNGIYPVSYTHLDVYKRQEQNQLELC